MTQLRGIAETAFAMIVEAARNHQPCPTNGEVAQRVGVFSRSCAQDAFKALETQGLITIERPAGNKRIATVVETGEKTAPTIAGGHTKRAWQFAEQMAERRERINRLRAAKMTFKDIALLLDISKARVVQIWRGPQRSRRQPVVIPIDAEPRTWCGQCDRRVSHAPGIGCGWTICGLRQEPINPWPEFAETVGIPIPPPDDEPTIETAVERGRIVG